MLHEKKKSLLIVAITQVIAYIFLFLIAWYIPVYDETFFNLIALVISVIIYGISFIKYPTKLLRWLWGIPIMWGLIMLYCPGDLYGISDPGPLGLDFFSAEFDAAIFAISLFFLQCVIRLVLFIGKVVKKKVYPM